MADLFKKIIRHGMGVGYYNGYPDDNARQSNGESVTEGYLFDLNNARRFSPGINPVRQKFQGYVNFNFNSSVDISSLNNNQTRNTLSSLCRTAEIPTADIVTDVKNQYNRKRITVTHAEMKPINVTAYDTVDSAWVIILMKAYAHLFVNPIGKYDTSGDSPTPKRIPADVVPSAVAGGGSEAIAKGQFESDMMGLNLRPANERNFITSMEVVKFHGQKALRYTLFNPMITNFEIDGIDHSDSSPAMISMTIQYENFSIDPVVNQFLTEEELERFSGFNLNEWELLRSGSADSGTQFPGGSVSSRSVLNNPAMGQKNLDFLTGGAEGQDVRSKQSEQFFEQFSTGSENNEKPEQDAKPSGQRSNIGGTI